MYTNEVKEGSVVRYDGRDYIVLAVYDEDGIDHEYAETVYLIESQYDPAPLIVTGDAITLVLQ